MLRQSLVSIIAQRSDLTAVTPSTQRFLVGNTGKEFSRWIASVGQLTSLTFLDGEAVGPEHVMRYRVVLDDNPFTFAFRLADGAICHGDQPGSRRAHAAHAPGRASDRSSQGRFAIRSCRGFVAVDRG